MIWNLLSPRTQKVPLPHNFNKDSMYALVDHIMDEQQDCRYSRIDFDFGRLRFIEPDGVSVLSNLIEYLKHSGARVTFSNFHGATPALNFLDDSGFFKHYQGKPLRPGSRVRTTTLPLQLVEYSRSYGYMENRLIPWLATALGVRQAALSTVKVCFHEIFNNIQDHSTVSIGCAFAQHYPNRQEVRICISDFGIGIPQNVRKAVPELTDQAAIERACREGFTTNTTPRNRGAGLAVLINNVVRTNGGSVIIHSGRGIYSCKRTGATVNRTPRTAPGFYPGTLVHISLNTRSFVADEVEEEDFEW
ncbi:ATP-binding protein [Ralstonia chuxiongensis]|uniref:ATP-binding protein n=1 Tax=Ralstonia chuxiongensis TaxID=2957504 RepID=UPI0028F61B1A|nr:ATP-binding protein [Ralstonia chuxiongensis]CAJ0781872.1 hypothetical protein R8510_04930 [Ralstonia chuxiongensis]